MRLLVFLSISISIKAAGLSDDTAVDKIQKDMLPTFTDKDLEMWRLVSKSCCNCSQEMHMALICHDQLVVWHCS
jgi:hypothetical protein